MTRHEFLRGLACLGALPLGCASDDGDGAEGGDPMCTSVLAEVDQNHGHALTVPAADVLAGEARTYMLSEGNGHTHEVTVSAPNMAKLGMGELVEVQTTTDGGHQHFVSLMC